MNVMLYRHQSLQQRALITVRVPLVFAVALFVALNSTVSREADAQSPVSRLSAPSTAERYKRYTPDECAQAPRQERQFWRGKLPDTLAQSPLGNPLHPSTVAAVQQCVAHLSVATVAPRDLLGLGAAYLAANQDANAAAAFARWELTLADSSLTARAWALYQVVDHYMDAAPSRLSLAETVVARLDALGAPAAAERLLAHLSIVERARIMDSLPLLDTHATAAIAASRQLVGDSAKQYAVPTARAYLARADLEMRRGDLTAARTTIKEISTITSRVRPRVMNYIEYLAPWYKPLGEPAPPIKATTWRNAPNDADRQAPRPGRPTLITFVKSDCGTRCYEGYGVLRRLMAKHPSLQVTLVTKTTGFYRTQLVPADSEATLVGDYFSKQLNFAVPLAIWETDFSKRADGRKVVKNAPNDAAYGMRALNAEFYPPVIVFLVDAAGLIRHATQLTAASEAMLSHAIADPALLAAQPRPKSASDSAKKDADTASSGKPAPRTDVSQNASEVLAGIKLTKAQQIAIDKPNAVFKELINRLMSNMNGGFDRVALRQGAKVREAEIRKVLTPDQQAIFDKNVKELAEGGQ